MANSDTTDAKSVVLYNASSSATSDEVDEIDLGDLLLYFLSRWKTLFVAMLLGAIVTGLVTFFLIRPRYEATSTIYVLSNKESALNLSDLQIGAALTRDYIEVFDIWEVHEKVISNLDLPYTYDQMQKMLTVTNKTDTRMIDITINSRSPEEAANIANEYAKVSSDFIAETMSTEKPNIVSTALVPVNPVSPSLVTNVAIGGVACLVLAAGILTVRHLNDDKIKAPEDVLRVTSLTTLAIMPLETQKKSGIKAKAKARKE